MKKIILLLTVVLSFGFMSCDPIIDTVTEARYSGIQLTDLQLGTELDSLEEIGEFLQRNITWKSGKYSAVQDPAETWHRGTGNCEDFSMLFANIAYFELGIKVEIVCVTHDDMEYVMSGSTIEVVKLEGITDISRAVESGGMPDHTIIRYNGIVYEPQNGNTYNVDVQYSYSFDTVFSY